MFAVSHAMCPEQDITDYISRLVAFPEALQVLEFADGRATLVCVRAYDGGLLVGKEIQSMREHLPADVDARIVAIFREHQPVDPDRQDRDRRRRRSLRARRQRAHPACAARAAAHAGSRSGG
jgi:Trk K+ transport system NAD-binding subunit